MRRGFKEIKRLAKTAAQWDMDSDTGYELFRRFALVNGVKTERLAYYVNAYQAAGDSGLKALTYKKRMAEKVRIEATKKMNEFFSARLPQNEHAGKLWFQIVTKNNRITVSERRPFYRDPSETTTTECFQARYTDDDARWHLFWKRASGKWWPYVPSEAVNTIEDCLREVDHDFSGCFWG